jgi:hypothetical protein
MRRRSEGKRRMRSRYYSTVRRERREWQRLQSQLKYGFADTRRLYPEEEDDTAWHMNEDPYEQLGPLSEWQDARTAQGPGRCGNRGQRMSDRFQIRSGRARRRHWGIEYDYPDRCPVCHQFFGTNSTDPDVANGF